MTKAQSDHKDLQGLQAQSVLLVKPDQLVLMGLQDHRVLMVLRDHLDHKAFLDWLDHLVLQVHRALLDLKVQVGLWAPMVSQDPWVHQDLVEVQVKMVHQVTLEVLVLLDLQDREVHLVEQVPLEVMVQQDTQDHWDSLDSPVLPDLQVILDL